MGVDHLGMFRDDEGALAAFDQVQATALERLREAKSFFCAVESESGVTYIIAIQNDTTKLHTVAFLDSVISHAHTVRKQAWDGADDDDDE